MQRDCENMCRIANPCVTGVWISRAPCTAHAPRNSVQRVATASCFRKKYDHSMQGPGWRQQRMAASTLHAVVLKHVLAVHAWGTLATAPGLLWGL